MTSPHTHKQRYKRWQSGRSESGILKIKEQSHYPGELLGKSGQPTWPRLARRVRAVRVPAKRALPESRDKCMNLDPAWRRGGDTTCMPAGGGGQIHLESSTSVRHRQGTNPGPLGNGVNCTIMYVYFIVHCHVFAEIS